MATDFQKPSGFIKESFGYKMSKKVAELTQVVHMLFSRNHEREVELDALKAAYEEEVFRITKEARNTFEKLEYLLRDATRQRQKDVLQAADNTAQLLKQTQEKMELLREELIDERSQTSHFRDLLSKTQEDLERTKQGKDGVSETLQQTNIRLKERETELTNLKKLYQITEDRFKVNERELDDIKVRFGSAEQKLAESHFNCNKLSKALEESNKRTEELSKKLLLADEEIKFAKREIKKRGKDKNSNSLHRVPMYSVPLSRQGSVKDEEIEGLRREVERLRMELSNREGNFNRVFSKFQPVVVSSETNSQKLQNSKMMMVTSSINDLDARRKYMPNSVLNSVRPNTDTSFFPKFPAASAGGVQFANLNSTNGLSAHHKSANSSQSTDHQKPSSPSRNSVSPAFRLVFTK